MKPFVAKSDVLDALDLQRLGLLTLATLDMSADRVIHLSHSWRGFYRVDVMAHDLHHTARSTGSMLTAMDQACDWLRRMEQSCGPANSVVRLRRLGRMGQTVVEFPDQTLVKAHGR